MSRLITQVGRAGQSGAEMTENRQRRKRQRAERTSPSVSGLQGGALRLVSEKDIARIVGAGHEILETIGMADAPEDVQRLVCAAGGKTSSSGRLLFPAKLVEAALDGLRRPTRLFGQHPDHDLQLSGTRVHMGTGGAAPLVLDPETDDFRPSTLADLYYFARLIDGLDNIHFFSRSVVARDMPTPYLLDINTCFACLLGTRKHVMTSAQSPQSVRDIATICHAIAGSREAFETRPFLSLNINHVVPPLRFDPEACKVMIAAAEMGIPVHANTFGQMGASSPVTMAGCVAQTVAETLAGMVLCWLVNPGLPVIFGPRPMITDLRSGGMAGGSGEQSVLTAMCVQAAQYLGLANSTIAGATDSKRPDAQSGYEKALSVAMAAQTGANLITQSCGMLAGLMGCSAEAYVIDNDMIGAVARSLTQPDVTDQTLSIDSIAATVSGDGHFLGHPNTLARMQSDFLYPQIADRQSPEQWSQSGGKDIRGAAREKLRQYATANNLTHLSPEIEAALRERFDIRLPPLTERQSERASGQLIR